MTQDRPDLPEIFRTLGEFARGVAARTSGAERYEALCALFLLEVAARELAAGDAPVRRQAVRLRELLDGEPDERQPYRDFCRRVRNGDFDQDWERAFTFALEQVIDKVQVTNPDCLASEHRDSGRAGRSKDTFHYPTRGENQ